MNKNSILILILAVIVIIAFIFFVRSNSSSSDNSQPTNFPTLTSSPTLQPEENATITPMENPSNELIIEDLKVGSGKVATAGSSVKVNYKGTLTNDVQFDSSYDRGEPFTFVLGKGQVIEGWDKGVAGMKVGGKRKLTIPPPLAYGDRVMGLIPANSTLIFEIELLEVE